MEHKLWRSASPRTRHMSLRMLCLCLLLAVAMCTDGTDDETSNTPSPPKRQTTRSKKVKRRVRVVHLEDPPSVDVSSLQLPPSLDVPRAIADLVQHTPQWSLTNAEISAMENAVKSIDQWLLTHKATIKVYVAAAGLCRMHMRGEEKLDSIRVYT